MRNNLPGHTYTHTQRETGTLNAAIIDSGLQGQLEPSFASLPQRASAGATGLPMLAVNVAA